jgi:hypothetical protein
MSDGIRPAEYFAAYKYLPVCAKDTSTEDYIVIPKGRIVAAISSEDSSVTGGMTYPASSGTIYTGTQASELGGAAMTTTIDNSFFGYQDNICGLLVFANGGTAYSGFYDTNDGAAYAGTLKNDGTAAVANDAFNLPVNAPIGVAYHDWYQDIRGKYLNYQMWPDGGGVLTDYLVEIPYVKVDTSGSYSGVMPTAQNSDYTHQNAWRTINEKWAYLTVDATNSDVFRNGVFVAPDLIGNYVIQGGASSMTQTVTPQTVGKIIAIDNRYPKGGLDDVQTYPGSGMSGTQTAGIPKFLFDFVYYCITQGVGTAPTVEGVYDAIRSGAFGTVRIQLHVS